MKILYVDNFRGFKDCYIPLQDINFLVGENSTGKTSILSILRLFTEPLFWMAQEFKFEGINFGTFGDLISANSTNRSTFSLGFIEHKVSEDENAAFYLVFEEKDGTPVIKRYCYCYKGHEVRVLFTGNNIRYKITKIDNLQQQEFELLPIFKKWTNPKNANKGYKKLSSKFPVHRKHALGYISGIIEREAYGDDKKSNKLPGISIFSPFQRITWIAPIRTKPKRTYDELKMDFTAEGEHTPYLIRMMFSKRKENREFKKLLFEFGRTSSLFDALAIRELGTKRLSAPFILNVGLSNKFLNLINVGYGVSQSLPIIVEILIRRKGELLSIQQPEIHLHPKAQAAFGEFIFKIAIKDKKKFIIETHSDYLIDRFRLKLRRSRLKIDSQILFFEKTRFGNKVHSIKIDKMGRYSEKQPKKFREFFIREELKLLGLR